MEELYVKIIKFSSLAEFVNFEKELKDYKDSKKEKKVENRGSKTKYLHNETKQYLLTHPGETYKSALKIVGKNLKDKNKKK